MSGRKEDLPLVVDLDGTLIKTDLLHESLIFALLKKPASLPRILKALLGGRAKFKFEAAKHFVLDASTLPYNESVLAEIRQAKIESRAVFLASASEQSLVDAVSNHLDIFDDAWGSRENTNLKSENKADELDSKLGEGNYEYVGNSKADLPIWSRARRAVIISSSNRLLKKLSASNPDFRALENDKQGSISLWLRQLRLHQWLKNVLLFIPAFVAFAPISQMTAISLILGFISFGLVASGVYVVNDLVDLNNDRAHEKKKFRPLASGEIPLLTGLGVGLAALVSGLGIAYFQGNSFFYVMVAYLVTTTIYTFVGKKLALVDALMLAFLYTLRIVAGGVLAEVPLSNWLLTMSVFLFVSLAWVKRYAELDAGLRLGKSAAIGRGYRASDLPVIQAFGIAAGFVAVLVFALFLDSADVSSKYASPEIGPLALAPLTYFVAHLWIKAHRGEMNQDPIIFAAKDIPSVVSGLAIVTVLIVAKFGI